jgi:MFS family permease
MALSLLSSGLWAIAVVWQVVGLGGGPAALSLVSALSAGGMMASTLLGGALADRIPQRRILLAVALTQAVTVAVLTLGGAVALWQLALVSLVGGLAMGLYYPACSALVPALVPEGDLLADNDSTGSERARGAAAWMGTGAGRAPAREGEPWPN